MNLECLFAYSYLWAWGLCSMQEYNVHLDRLFSETPNNKILLELRVLKQLQGNFCAIEEIF